MFFSTLYKQRFQLSTKEIEITIIKKNPISNLMFFFLKMSRKNKLIRFLLKFLLRLPHWLTTTTLGYIFTQICFIWAFIGREPITATLSGIYILELFTFIVSLKIFLHMEGVYKFCLEEFGPEFMEYYIDNPLSKQVVRGGFLTIGAFTGISANEYNTAVCHDRMMFQAQTMIDQLDHKPCMEELKEIYTISANNNQPLVSQFSNIVTTTVSKIGKKLI